MLDPIKDVIRLSGLPDPVLHAGLGLAIYLAAAILLRVPLSSWKPWLVALACQLLNELADVVRDLVVGNGIPVRGSTIDTAVTMFLPTLILSISRYRERHRRRH